MHVSIAPSSKQFVNKSYVRSIVNFLVIFFISSQLITFQFQTILHSWYYVVDIRTSYVHNIFCCRTCCTTFWFSALLTRLWMPLKMTACACLFARLLWYWRQNCTAVANRAHHSQSSILEWGTEQNRRFFAFTDAIFLVFQARINSLYLLQRNTYRVLVAKSEGRKI